MSLKDCKRIKELSDPETMSQIPKLSQYKNAREKSF